MFICWKFETPAKVLFCPMNGDSALDLVPKRHVRNEVSEDNARSSRCFEVQIRTFADGSEVPWT
jgi:hypothetical protein